MFQIISKRPLISSHDYFSISGILSDVRTAPSLNVAIVNDPNCPTTCAICMNVPAVSQFVLYASKYIISIFTKSNLTVDKESNLIRHYYFEFKGILKFGEYLHDYIFLSCSSDSSDEEQKDEPSEGLSTFSFACKANLNIDVCLTKMNKEKIPNRSLDFLCR